MPLIEASFKDVKTGNSDNSKLLHYGPTLVVSVASFMGEQNNQQKIKNVYALVDTGASTSMIDSQLANELELIAVDKAYVSGVYGKSQHLVYIGAIIVPQLDIQQLGQFVAINLKDGGQEHEVLLGRDFLSNTVMIYDGIRAQVTIASSKFP